MPKLTLHVGREAVNVGIDVGFIVRCENLRYFICVDEDVFPDSRCVDVFTMDDGDYDLLSSPTQSYESWTGVVSEGLRMVIEDIKHHGIGSPEEPAKVEVEVMIIQESIDALFMEKLARKENDSI